MHLKKRAICAACAITLILSACGSASISQEDYAQLEQEKEDLQKKISQLEGEKTDLQSDLDEANASLSALQEELGSADKQIEDAESKYQSLEAEYNQYKEEMKPFEEMTVAQAEAEKAKAEEEKRQLEEAEAERVAAEEAEAARIAAEEAAKGYETGITYDQLARTPDDYTGKKVKFRGKVVQVIDGTDEIDIRLAVNSDYDTVLYCAYEPGIVSFRVLEDDVITIYGVSLGLYSYQSTFGGTITIPAVWIDRIDQ